MTDDDWTQPMMKTREYTLVKYAVNLRIRDKRISRLHALRGEIRLREPERVQASLWKWLSRSRDRHERMVLIAVTGTLVGPDLAMDGWWRIGCWVFAVRNVHPDDREVVQHWLNGGITSHYRLIVPVFEPIRLGRWP